MLSRSIWESGTSLCMGTSLNIMPRLEQLTKGETKQAKSKW